MLELLSKHSSLGFLVIELKNKKVHTNFKYHDILDVEINYVFSYQLFKTLINLISNRAQFLSLLKQAKRNQTSLVGEFKLKRTKNSIPQWLSIDAYFLVDKNNKADKLVVTITDISELKNKQQIQKLIASAVDNVNHAIVITEAEPVDFPGPRILYVNESFTETTGYTLDEVKGKSPRILQGEKTDAITLLKLKQALKKWQPIKCELLNYKKNGEEFWVKLDIRPVKNSKGWYTHWVSVQRDITKQKKVETALNSNILKTERILNSLNECIWGVSLPDFKVEFHSPSTVDLYEFPLKDWHENINLWIDCVHPEDKERVLLNSTKLYENGEVIQEYRIITGTKKVKWISSTTKIIKDENGTPVLMTGISSDITARKIAEQQLIESEFNLQNLLDSSLELIFSLDKEGNIIIANRTFHRLFNSIENTYGKVKIQDLVIDLHKEKFLYHFDLAKKNEIVEKLTISIKHESGKEIHLKGNLIPLIKNKEVFTVQCFFIDITQKVELEKDKEQFEQELKKVQTNEKIGTFIYDYVNDNSLVNDEVVNELFGIDASYKKSMLRLFSLIHPDDRELVQNNYINAISTKNKFQEEFRIIRKNDQSVRWVKYIADFEFNQEGKPIKSSGTVKEVTQQKNSETELIKITEQVDYLFKNAEEIFFTLDSKNKKILYISKCTLNMYGYSNEEFYQEYNNIFSLVHPEDLSVFLSDSDLLLSRQSVKKEYRIIHKQTGKIKWVESISSPQFDHENNLQALNIITKDITSRKENELNLKATLIELKQYKDAINRSAIVSITDAKGIITFVNDKFSEISSYEKSELIGKSHNVVNSGFHSKEFFEDLWKTIKSGSIWKGQIKNKTKTGTYYWVDSTIIPFIENGEPYQFLSIRYDITENIKIKEDIVKQKQFYETILNEIPADIAVFDKNYRYIFLNPNAVKDDETRKFMIGKTDFDYAELRQKDIAIAKKRQQLLREATKTKAGITFEETLQVGDSEKKYVLRKTYPYYNKNQEVQYVIGFGLDITKEKMHELSLAQSLVEKETLLGEIHHRVKNNLALIDGVVELKKALEKDKYIIDTLSDIQSRIKTVALVHQKLYQNEVFSKIDINDYINELASYHQKLFNKQNADTVVFEVLVENVFFDISKSVSFGLLLNELVSNSLKYGVINNQVTINISVLNKDNCIEFIYKDSGKGLQKNLNEYLKKGFGFKLIQTLIKQFKASHQIVETDHFEIRISIPV
jgi:PAS domain S-box-containing protein